MTEMTAPCQPIGCDNGYHLPGCVFAAVDAPEPPRLLSSDGGCPCFYADPLPDVDDEGRAYADVDPDNPVCSCGHALDEHDDTGQCQGEVG